MQLMLYRNFDKQRTMYGMQLSRPRFAKFKSACFSTIIDYDSLSRRIDYRELGIRVSFKHKK